MKEFIFTCNFENIQYSGKETGNAISSPKFIANTMYNTSWILGLYPRGYKNSDYVSLSLCRKDRRNPDDLAINIEFSCITADGSECSKCFISEEMHNFAHGDYCKIREPYFVKRNEVFGHKKAVYLPRGILTVRLRMWKDIGDSYEFGESFGRTHLEIETIHFVQNANFENSVKETFRVQSEEKDKELMSVSILNNCETIDVEIMLIRNAERRLIEFAICRLYLKDKRIGEGIFEYEFCFSGLLEKNKWRFSLGNKVLPVEIEDSNQSHFNFTIEIVYSTGEEKQIIENECPLRITGFLSDYIDCSKSFAGFPPISEDLWELSTGKILHDLKVEAQGKVYPVHEFVLCASSPVFLAMLESPMKEKEFGFVEIRDVLSSTVDKFLVFLYLDSIVPSSWNEASELYYMADKYQVGRLKIFCCIYLLKNINIDNICELLILADRHFDDKLKRKVNAIIRENEEVVFTSPAWKKFVDEHIKLAMKTMLSKYEEKDLQKTEETYEELLCKLPEIQHDMVSLYRQGTLNDITIKTAGASYAANKAVLGASSSIFRDILSNDLTDVIEIKDLEDDTISRLLLFLHADSLEDIQWDIAKKLYHAAFVYKISRLKFKTSCYLIENLRVSNACDLLLLAVEHRDLTLKRTVKDFISTYNEDVFGSNEWSDMCFANPQLALETVREKYGWY